jgi:hypothetical protein
VEDTFTWDTGSRQYLCCVSAARSWAELRPALVAAWVRFADVLSTRVPVDLRHEINLSFFSSSGRVTFNHAQRDYAVADLRWDLVPTDHVWCVACRCAWIEEQWFAIEDETLLAELGVTFAKHCLAAASDSAIQTVFRGYGFGHLLVRGQGVTQSPAAFESDLNSLFEERYPELLP